MLRKIIIFLCLVLFLGTIIFVLLNSNNQRNIYYFGYGSNMDLNLLRARIDNNSIVPISFAVLEDYKLIFPRGVGSVILEDGKEVYGCLYLLNKKEIEKLDVVESYRVDRDRNKNSYVREKISVITSDNKTIEADIYIQVNNTDINGKPSNSYKQTLVRGARDCSLPDFYIQELEAIETK